MRGLQVSVDTNMPPYREQTPEMEGDSQSSSSNSPARADEESDFYGGNNDSQSSIGVSTFQDMAVTEEQKVSPANRLPAEVLISIFQKVVRTDDLLNCMCVSKRWARNCVDILWHRPACTTWDKHKAICSTLTLTQPYFEYRDFIKRLNLANLAVEVSDGSVYPLAVCKRVERLTLTNCINLTDSGLMGLITDSNHLLALDISGDVNITEASMVTLADNCPRLQGLNVTGCSKIANEAMIKVAESCKYIKRLKLNGCFQLQDSAIMAFAKNCRNILEIDLHMCYDVGNEPITALLKNGQSLRELRLANCDRLDDGAFLNLPPPSYQTYEHLRILDLTSCARLTDRSVEKIIEVAPRIRNLVFAKCRNITDASVYAIAKLGRNLHYLHLGHCGLITDDSVVTLVSACTRIRYIDLGCCTFLTDKSVMKLATLPKLRRVGLVKCSSITDASVYALARVLRRPSSMGSSAEIVGICPPSSLERVHLSYCVNLTLQSIIVLLNNCQKLTHLSLTGVHAFLRNDLSLYCREAPAEFTEHQRSVFCVFSGAGVSGLRDYLNSQTPRIGDDNLERNTIHDGEDDQTMTGMMNAAALNADDDGDDGDEDENIDADGDAADT